MEPRILRQGSLTHVTAEQSHPFGYILQLLPLKMAPGKGKKKNPRKYLHRLNVVQEATSVARRMWHPLPYPCEEGKVGGESLFVSHGLWEEPTHRTEAS